MKQFSSQKPLRSRNTVLRAEKERKRKEADARQTTSDALTPQQRLAKLDALLGTGIGAVRELTRLALQIEANDQNLGLKIGKPSLDVVAAVQNGLVAKVIAATKKQLKAK